MLSGTIIVVLDYTWSDLEAEIVLRNLNVPTEEKARLRDYYKQLREEYRNRAKAQARPGPEAANSAASAG